jgi:hypothetical protein
VQLAGRQQAHEMLGVAAIGLDAIAGRARDLARRRDDTFDLTSRELARQPVTGRPRLIRGAHRPRKTGAQPRRLDDIAAQPEVLHLTGLGIEHRRDDLRGVHVQTDEASSLRHGWLLLCDCGAPRGCRRVATNSPHDRRGGTGPFYR